MAHPGSVVNSAQSSLQWVLSYLQKRWPQLHIQQQTLDSQPEYGKRTSLFGKRWSIGKILMQVVTATLCLTISSHQQVCCILPVSHCGLSSLQWERETKANWLTDDLILISNCMPSLQGIRLWTWGTPICPGCISWCLHWWTHGTELQSSSHALHHLPVYQLFGLGLGTMCWM